MKKFLIMLTVVAMASFLFVGCLPGVTPEPEPPAVTVAVTGVTLNKTTLPLTVGDAAVTLVATVAPATATDTSVIWASSDETKAIVAAGVVTPLNAGISAITATTVDGGFVATCVVTVSAVAIVVPPVTPAQTDAPIITDAGTVKILATTTQYVKDITTLEVDGVGVPGALIKLYIDDVYAGIGRTDSSGAFSNVVVSAITVTEGVKKFYVTATVSGLAESLKSTEYTFTFDETKPKIASAVADSSGSTITVTFNEDVNVVTLAAETATWSFDQSALNEDNWSLPAETTWTSVSKISDKEVEITVDAIVVGTPYTIGCKNLEDKATNIRTTYSYITVYGTD